MKVKHVLSLAEIGPQNLSYLVTRGLAMAHDENENSRPLEGKIVGIYFRGPSTRTRTSFTVAALKLGAQTISYGANDLQISTGETIQDTTRVLSGYLDALVIRTNETIEEMNALAQQDRMSIINAMSANEHPTQAIADLITLQEAFGQLDGIHVLYLGEGNNTAAALALAVALTPGMRLTLVTPAGYGLCECLLQSIYSLARRNRSLVEHHHRIDDLPQLVDAVYTTRWSTMGVEKKDVQWRTGFESFTVTSELMQRVSKPAKTYFLHDLPAVRGDDVVDEVLDGPQSLAFVQAQHKLSSAMAVLEWCLAPL
jgi:ornithine carbamoyltransferase